MSIRESAAAQLRQLPFIVPAEKDRNSLTRPLLHLLNDATPSVLAKLLPNLALCLPRLSFDERQSRDLCQAALKTDTVFERQWRLSRDLAAALPAIAAVVPPDAVYESLLPLAFHYMTNAVAAVRDVAAVALVGLFRMLRKERERTEVSYLMLWGLESQFAGTRCARVPCPAEASEHHVTPTYACAGAGTRPP